jgi:hypothetical protein
LGEVVALDVLGQVTFDDVEGRQVGFDVRGPRHAPAHDRLTGEVHDGRGLVCGTEHEAVDVAPAERSTDVALRHAMNEPFGGANRRVAT